MVDPRDPTAGRGESQNAIDAMELSYQQSMMSFDRSGRMVSKEQKAKLREQLGYCLSCPGLPVRLYNIKRSRLNPLWCSKKAREAEGECANGRCLRCHPIQRRSQHLGLSSQSQSESSEAESVQRPQNAQRSQRHSICITSQAGRSQPSGTQMTRSSSARPIRASSDPAPAGSLLSQSTHASLSIKPRGAADPILSHSGHVSLSTKPRGGGRSADPLTSRSSHTRYTADPLMSNSSHSRKSLPSGNNSHADHLQGHSDHSRSGRRPSITNSNIGSHHSSGDRRPSMSNSSADPLQGHSNDARRPSITNSNVGSHHSSGDRGPSMSSSSADPLQDHSNGGRRPSITNSNASSRHSSGDRRPSMSNSSSNDNSDTLQSSSNHSRRPSLTGSDDHQIPDRSGRQSIFRANSCQSLLSICSLGEDSEDEMSYDIPAAILKHTVKAHPPSEEDIVKGLIVSLEALFSDIMATGESELITDIIISSMDSHFKVEKVQAFCIRTLAVIFTDSQFDCTCFLQANGHGRILLAMKSFPSSLEIHTQCCEALAALSSREIARTPLIRVGVCDFIDKALLRFLGEEKVAENAIQVLRSLSFEPEGSELLRRTGMMDKIVEVMYCNSASAALQRDGCALLSNLAVDVAKQSVLAVDKSILSVVVAAIKEHKHDQSVVASACFALKNLSYEESNLRSLARNNSLLEALLLAQQFPSASEDAEIVTERMQISLAEDQSLEEHICASLRALVGDNPDQPDIIVDVLETLKNNNWSERTTAECVEILISLVEQSEVHRSKLSERSNLRHLEAWAHSSEFNGGIREDTLRLIGIVNNTQQSN
jgi:hypothetical protein